MHLTLCLLFFFIPEYGAVPLLMSFTRTIKLFEESDATNTTTLTPKSHHVIALDYHLARGETYYSDATGQIFRGRLRPEGVGYNPVVIAEVKVTDGLAVDWVHDNLYWTDVIRTTLEVSTLDGLYRTILFNASHGLQRPRAVVVDPPRGLLFWSDWGSDAKIESSGLDGKQKKTVVSANLIWPNGLTLDLANSKIYILDGFASTLSSCEYDGSNFEVLSRSQDNFQQAFGLAFYANTVYWNSWRSRTLFKMNTNTLRTETLLLQSGLRGIIERMMGLKAVHTSLQQTLTTADPCKTAGCSQWCLVSRDLKPSCMCAFGYVIASDGKTCIEEGYLLVSWRQTIRRFNMNGSLEEPMIDTTKAVIALSYHLKKGLVFWSDIEEHRIYRAPIEQLNNKTVVANPETCDGLAVDWVHDVLYWTDADRNTLEAAQLDGTKHMVIFSTDLDQPRDIALDPLSGLLFWTDWGDIPKIERSTLDGLERTVIISDNQVWPNGITLDIVDKKIYWVDGKLATITSSSYDGSDKKLLFIPSPLLSLHPFSITILKDELFWTDWQSRSLFRCTKKDIKNAAVIASSSNATVLLRPNGVKAVHSSLQPPMDNPCAAVQCTNLCLGTKSHTAHCMEEERPDADVGSGSHSVLPELVKTAFNDSINIILKRTETPLLVVITLKCLSREGCTDDPRCVNKTLSSYMFRNQSSFHITDLLPASHYEINFMSPKLVESFNITTSGTDPPQIPKITSLQKQGTKVTITWDPVDTCLPGFNSYHYKLFKTAADNDLVRKGSTNLTEVTFDNLDPEVSYTIHVYTYDQNHFSSFEIYRDEPWKCKAENFLCNGNEDCPDGRDEDINLCAAIENIVVYKNNETDAYFRVTVANNTKKQLDKFVGNYVSETSNNLQQFEMAAIPCTMWPESYCFHISALQGHTVYNFKISAALKTGKVGSKFAITTITKEKVSEPPENVKVIKYNATSLVIEWRHPNQSNGIIKSFIINIDESKAYIEENCCQSFPILELSETAEQQFYEMEATQLTPATTYAISITARNMYVGMPATIVASTPPPPMKILRSPKIKVKSLLPLTWLKSELSDYLSQYTTLIRSYMLLLLPPKSEPLDNSGNYYLGPLNKLLQLKLGERFVVLWHKEIRDLAAFQTPIPVYDLTPHKEYKLVWVQVSQYNEAYNVDMMETDPFIAL